MSSSCSHLHPARFLHRPNRFVVHARLEDTGEGRGRPRPPDRAPRPPAAASSSAPLEDTARKTRWSAVLVQTPRGNGWVSVDTTLPNHLAARALESGVLQELSGWRLERAEYAPGGCRFDFPLGDVDGRAG